MRFIFTMYEHAACVQPFPLCYEETTGRTLPTHDDPQATTEMLRCIAEESRIVLLSADGAAQQGPWPHSRPYHPHHAMPAARERR